MDNQTYKARANSIKNEIDNIIKNINSVQGLIESSYQGKDNEYKGYIDKLKSTINQLKTEIDALVNEAFVVGRSNPSSRSNSPGGTPGTWGGTPSTGNYGGTQASSSKSNSGSKLPGGTQANSKWSYDSGDYMQRDPNDPWANGDIVNRKTRKFKSTTTTKCEKTRSWSCKCK